MNISRMVAKKCGLFKIYPQFFAEEFLQEPLEGEEKWIFF
jgi:hypothetical protein